LRDECRFTHAYLVLDDGQCIEAMPAGARITPLAGRTGPGYAYARLPLTAEQRANICAARTLRGTPYSFADYAALSAKHLGVPTPLLRRYISSSKRMICSQLVDYALCAYALDDAADPDSGFHLFKDGRLPQDVTPGGLFWQAGALGQIAWW
jgi:hypothetical protein